MSCPLFKAVNFGTTHTGLSTVGYTLTGGVRVTAGITELAAGSGIYGTTITFVSAFSGSLIWDTGQGASTVYYVEEINLPPVPPPPVCPAPFPVPSQSSALNDANEADEALVHAVHSPRRVHSDAGSVESHSIPDLIAASNYLASVAATRLKRRGLRFNHLTAAGTVGRRAGGLGGFGDDNSFGIVGGFPG